MIKNDLLRINLQYFAEESEQETDIDEEQKETNSTDASENTGEETKESVDNRRIPYARFKEKVDEANALKEKLAEIEKAQAEAKRKELEETEQYKELYEQALKDAEKAKAEALSVKKSALLTQAGYDAEQSKLLVKLVDGDSDDEIAESIKLLKATIPVHDGYGDPSALNSVKDKPRAVDADDIGVKAFERIKHKIFN